MNAIYQGNDGWYFWDEVWTNAIGPYTTEEQCREAMVAYLMYLMDDCAPTAHCPCCECQGRKCIWNHPGHSHKHP